MPLSESPVVCVGASHATVPLDVLERLSIPESEIASLLGACRSPGRRPGWRSELIVLSTCNRTELYAVAGGPGSFRPADSGKSGTPAVLADIPEHVVLTLEKRTGLSRTDLAAFLYRHESGDAERHLFRVITGLDSLVVGETQIVGQVARAYAAAQRAGSAGPALSLLFESAIRGSRSARARAGGGQAVSSASSMAVRRAGELAGALSRLRVLVIGTGEMGRLVLRALRKSGAGRIEIVTRSEERSASLSERWGISVHTVSRLSALVGGSDVVISSTSSSEPILTEAMARAAMDRRPGRPLLLIDIAVPRTIERRAALVPGVKLLDIDSLKDPDRPGNAGDDPVITALIREELALLELRMAEMSLRPVIGGMWRKADGIRDEVLARTRARLPQLDEQSWVHVENLAHALVAKLLHDPATRLRAEAGNGHARAYAEALRHLFGLPEASGPGPR